MIVVQTSPIERGDREAREVALHDLRRAERRRADAEGAGESGVLAGVRQHEDDHAEREQHVDRDRDDAEDLAHGLTLPAPATENRRFRCPEPASVCRRMTCAPSAGQAMPSTYG